MCCVNFCGLAQKLSKTKKITQSSYTTNPLVSPNGDYVLTTSENLKGVYLLELKTKKITEISKATGSGYAYTWSSDGKSFYFKEKQEKDYMRNAVVKCYDIATKSTKKVAISPNYLPSFKGEKEANNIVVYTNLSTLKIEAIDLKTNQSWIITRNDGQFYNAILSNDGKKIVVHQGADIYIYPVEGAEIGTKIGTGIATAWSANDSYLIGFLDESKDGHQISNSDLYLFDSQGKNTKRLTNTDTIHEMFPCFYGKDSIMYTDEKTGQLLTSKIVF